MIPVWDLYGTCVELISDLYESVWGPVWDLAVLYLCGTCVGPVLDLYGSVCDRYGPDLGVFVNCMCKGPV